MSALTDEEFQPIRRKLTPEEVEQRRQQVTQIMRDAPRTVTTFDEWQAWTTEGERHWDDDSVSVRGELADQFRRRLDAASDAPVRIIEQYDICCMGFVVSVDVGDRKISISAAGGRGDYDWTQIREWLEDAA